MKKSMRIALAGVLLAIVAVGLPACSRDDGIPALIEEVPRAQQILPRPQIEPNTVHAQPADMAKPKGLALTHEEYPRTGGSTSAEPMGLWVASRLLGLYCMWPSQYWDERRMIPMTEEVDPSKSRDKVATIYKKTSHGGTHGSYKALIEGKLDLIYECRVPSEDERKLMTDKKVELELTPIALDAFVFLRHKSNTVTSLTLDQIRGIYDSSGKLTNWSQFGGVDRKIDAYTRNRNSGSQETMQSLVMKDRTVKSGNSMTGYSMAGPYNMMHHNVAGMGYTFFYYQRYMSPLLTKWDQQANASVYSDPPVEMFAVNGVDPTRETIANGSYPLVTLVYVVTRKDLPADHPAAKLRDWLVTEEGQRVVGETGYIPIAFRKD